MKYCKHYFLFLLASALLLLPVTSHYAISWKDIQGVKWEEVRKRASTLMAEDTMKIIPGAVIVLGLAAGGLYYYLMNKKVDTPIRSLVTTDYVWPQLKQFKVYCQFNADGGGAASCGYQTLLRGMQVVASKYNNQNETQLKKNLMSVELIDKYFGKNGLWRGAIIKKRNNADDKGEWLNDEEMEYLWKNYRLNFIPEDVNSDFFAIPDFSRVETEFDELTSYIKDRVRPFLNVNNGQKLFRIFALGTMKQFTDTFGIDGHWYPLVMYQNGAGKREYYIMDSGSYGETNRLNDTNAWKIINLIEQ